MFFVGEKLKQIKVVCWVDYASYFYEKKDFQRAIESYKKALLLDPNDYYANIGLACALVADKSFEESLASFEKAISIRKSDTRVLPSLFVAYKASGKEDLAGKVLLEIVQSLDNSEAAAHDLLAYTYFSLDIFTEAEQHSNKALEISPDKGHLHYNLGKIYFAQEKTREAKVEFLRAVELARDKREKRLVSYASHYLRDINRKEMKGVP
ncbi:MAG: tetratricopeptide repeat protein [Syntrophales bacterium]